MFGGLGLGLDKRFFVPNFESQKWSKEVAVSVFQKMKNPLTSLTSNVKFTSLKSKNDNDSKIKKEELLDRFINIIQVEDDEENPQETFFNHPYNRRRTDREEIRRKLAMGTDDDLRNDRQMKKPSLHSRLQNGKNLQICFMNETASDCESQCSDTESTQDRIDEVEVIQKEGKLDEHSSKDFPSYQAKLQEEARLALSQAKEMARMEMQLQKQNRVKSPITEIVRGSFSKVGFPFPETKRRMSRQILTDMNVAQLQVIVNEFHTQIENLNEVLVQLLLKRDDLHMEQDSMLVDIEDLTKHLGAKEQFKFLKSEGKGVPVNNKNKNSFVVSSSSSKTSKLKAFVKK